METMKQYLENMEEAKQMVKPCWFQNCVCREASYFQIAHGGGKTSAVGRQKWKK